MQAITSNFCNKLDEDQTFSSHKDSNASKVFCVEGDNALTVDKLLSTESPLSDFDTYIQ